MAFVGRRKVSAFSVYKQRRSQEEEREGPNTTDSTANGGSRESSCGGEGEGEGKEPGEQSSGKKRRAVHRRMKLPSKKRKVDASQCVYVQESESSEGSGHKKKKKKKKKKKDSVLQRDAITAKGKKAASKQQNPATDDLVSSSKKKKIKSSKKDEREDDSNEEEVSSEVSSAGPPPTSPEQLEVHSVDGGEMVVPFFSQFDMDAHHDSRDAGRELLRLLINPLPVDDFFKNLWEQRPLLLRRHKPQYNDGWFSTKEFDRILRKNSLDFTTNIDVTSYQDGERCTHNPDGRAVPEVVWGFYQAGCSIRLLNPQTYSRSMWLLTATLQEYFQSFVGANVYLTPAGTQGFAPHSDDIEAFVLQLEGRKHWRLYSPRNTGEVLPRCSSPNLSQAQLGTLILDVILEPGDLLYFPRGTYHQAESMADVHSMHITLSTYQQYTWGDVMAKLMHSTMEVAMREDVSFRRGLPLGCLNYTGRHYHPNTKHVRRVEFMRKMREYLEKLVHIASDACSMDSVMDQMATDNVHSSLPPCFTDCERACSVLENGMKWRDGGVMDEVKFSLHTEVKLARYNAIRLVTDGEGHTLYYNHQNSRVFQEKDIHGIPLDSSDAQLIERLIKSYPDYIKIKDLINNNEDSVDGDQGELLYVLYSHSIILTH